MQRLLVGTNNQHKLQEIRAILHPLQLVSPDELGIKDQPIEDGKSFEENARIKARFFHEASGLPCIADDSGLVVDALDGRPGIHSARYADSDQARIQRLLDELQSTPEELRSARFTCYCAFVNGETEKIESGFCEGSITTMEFAKMVSTRGSPFAASK